MLNIKAKAKNIFYRFHYHWAVKTIIQLSQKQIVEVLKQPQNIEKCKEFRWSDFGEAVCNNIRIYVNREDTK